MENSNSCTSISEVVGKVNIDKLNQMGPESKIKWLKDYALTLDKGSDLCCVQKRLAELMEEDLQFNPLESALPSVQPDEYDVIINDIRDSDFSVLGAELGITRLSPASTAMSFPISGIMFGEGCRIFVPLVVTKRSTSVHVIFLYDTGSPSTYLRADTLRSLGFMENTPSATNVNINGTAVNVHCARGHFENVDLLGQDFMRAARLNVSLNYAELSASLIFKNG